MAWSTVRTGHSLQSWPAMDAIPRFDELEMTPDLGLRHAWGVFGEDDRLGRVNLLDAAAVLTAASEVRSGQVLSLDLPLNWPDPPLFGRQPYQHDVFALSRNEMDDRLDNFHLQASTQWDALGHVRCREHGYWGGRTDNPTVDSNELGIDNWANHGMVGRGVLVDVAGYRASIGQPLDPFQPEMIDVSTLRDALEAEGVSLRQGDMLCVRFGWTAGYKALDRAGREAMAASPTFCGLRPDEDMARFLWDSGVVALCCDNPAIEPVPGDPEVGSLHRRILPLLGMALGEMFDFDALADACHQDNRWTFLFVGVPLKLPRGIGSPGNAVAIR